MKNTTLVLAWILSSLSVYSHLLIANELDPEFRLISSNGLQWNEVTNIPSHLTFNFPRTSYSPGGNSNTTWSLDTELTLYKGNCENMSCSPGSNPVIFSAASLSVENFTIGPLNPSLVYGSSGFFSINSLKNICNNQLNNNPDAIYDNQQINNNLWLTLRTKGKRTLAGPAFPQAQTEYVDVKKRIKFDVAIVCESIGPNPGSIDANELKVFLSTSSNAISQPSAGTECPITKFTTRIKTNRAGTLAVMLSRQTGIEPMVKKQKNIVSTLQSDGSFVGRHEEWISVGQSSVVRVKAEEVDNPYALNDTNLSTPWKEISIVCAGSGGIGLSGQTPAGSGNNNNVNPTLPGSSTISITPDHTGGGGAPAALSARSPFSRDTKDKTVHGGLRSDGELVQAKKGSNLLRHEQTHTKKEAENTLGNLNSNLSSHKRLDTHDKLANQQTNHQKQSIPLENATISGIRSEQLNNKSVLYRGKLGDSCSAQHFPNNAITKQSGKQYSVVCNRGKVTLNRTKKGFILWKEGDPVFTPTTPNRKSGPDKLKGGLGDEMPEDLPAG